jgi:hypothetical protein
MPSVQLNTKKNAAVCHRENGNETFPEQNYVKTYSRIHFFFQKYNSQLTELGYGLIVAFIRHKICYGASEKISEKFYYFNGDNCDHDKNSHNQCTKWKFRSAS